jgi:hypothetical protein
MWWLVLAFVAGFSVAAIVAIALVAYWANTVFKDW